MRNIKSINEIAASNRKERKKLIWILPFEWKYGTCSSNWMRRWATVNASVEWMWQKTVDFTQILSQSYLLTSERCFFNFSSKIKWSKSRANEKRVPKEFVIHSMKDMVACHSVIKLKQWVPNEMTCIKMKWQHTNNHLICG